MSEAKHPTASDAFVGDTVNGAVANIATKLSEVDPNATALDQLKQLKDVDDNAKALLNVLKAAITELEANTSIMNKRRDELIAQYNADLIAITGVPVVAKPSRVSEVAKSSWAVEAAKPSRVVEAAKPTKLPQQVYERTPRGSVDVPSYRNVESMPDASFGYIDGVWMVKLHGRAHHFGHCVYDASSWRDNEGVVQFSYRSNGGYDPEGRAKMRFTHKTTDYIKNLFGIGKNPGLTGLSDNHKYEVAIAAINMAGAMFFKALRVLDETKF